MTVGRLDRRLERIEHAQRQHLTDDVRAWTDAKLHAALEEGRPGFTAWLRSLSDDEVRELVDRPDVAVWHAVRFEKPE